MAGMHHIGWHDGWLCVISEHVDPCIPNTEVDYWPVERCTYHVAKASGLLGASCERTVDVGEYRAWVPPKEQDVGLDRPVMLPGYHKTVRLADGGRTKMIHHENVPVPCPRVRKGIQTRWYNGRWQKYLKLEGWVSA